MILSLATTSAALLASALAFQTPAEPAEAPDAPAADTADAPDPLRNLRRGVNLSHWYAQSLVGGYGEEHLSTYFTEADADKIRDMGFDHVRLTLNETVLFDPANPGDLKAEELERFRGRVDMLLGRDLAVIVDLHPDGPFKESLHDEAAVEALAEDWAALAGSLKDVSPDVMVFEVMNEPGESWGTVAWLPVQAKLATAIREAAPDHRIVVSGGSWSNAGTLPEVFPDEDVAGLTNLVYTFHMYDPFLYTHQSAEWGGAAAASLTDVPWPVEAENEVQAEAALAGVEGSDDALAQLKRQAATGRMSRAYLDGQFDWIAKWQAAYGGPAAAPVYVGEFGVYLKAGSREDRLAYHAAVREAAERHGFGWAIWDYAAGFGVVSGPDRTPDAEMLEALGLHEGDAAATVPAQ